MIRPCAICHQSDDGPRHASAGAVTSDQNLEGEPHYHHFTCGAAQGCALCINSLETLNG